MYWVIVASDWAGSVVQVLRDDDELPACEGRRFRLIGQTEDEAVARRIMKREEWPTPSP